MGWEAWVFGALGGLTALILGLMWKYPWLKYDFSQIWIYGKAAIWVIRNWQKLLIDVFEEHVQKIPEKTFLIYQDNRYTYKCMNSQANKVARLAQKLGWKQGDIVALFIHNEPAYIWTYLGLMKVGVQVSCLNIHLRSKSLLHCIKVSGARAIIVGQGKILPEAISDIYTDLDVEERPEIFLQGSEPSPNKAFKSFNELFEAMTGEILDPAVRKGITGKDIMSYIYTSGTTGLPKPAVITHLKAIKGATVIGMKGASSQDVIYTQLPLYHSATTLVGLGGAIKEGATLVLGNKFSASQFWEECRRNKVTVIQYIGELCRYLLAQPLSANDRNHNVRLAFGGALRRDIWEEFQSRFGIEHIGEYYSSTEGNAAIINLHNKAGSIGRLSPLTSAISPAYLVKYNFDTAEPLRNEKGLCTEVKPGETGLLVIKIKMMSEFDGYRGNRELSDKKKISNVFVKGDVYFNTGDLIVQDKDYFAYFSDRIGDTFRWKGENVSTIEVSNVVSDLDFIEDANVYGVEIPAQDGRCGMASLTLKDSSQKHLSPNELHSLYQHCEDLLPSYARPRFLRIQKQAIVTDTLKHKKFTLVKEGFNPSLCHGEALYCLSVTDKSYVVIDEVLYDKIVGGQIRL